MNPFGSNLNPPWGRSLYFSLLKLKVKNEIFGCSVVFFGGSFVRFRSIGFGSGQPERVGEGREEHLPGKACLAK